MHSLNLTAVLVMTQNCCPHISFIQCCIQLAQGKLSTEQLTDEVLSLISTHTPRHGHRPGSSLTTVAGEQGGGGDTRPSVEVMWMMQRLSDRAIYAQQCCGCIATCFKIAVVSHFILSCIACDGVIPHVHYQWFPTQ